VGRRHWIRAAIFTLIFFLPAVLNRGAIHFADLGPYHLGGEMIVRTLTGVLAPAAETEAAVLSGEAASGASASEPAAEPAKSAVKGVRSPYFSLFAYVLSAGAPRFLLLAFTQAAVVGFLFAAAMRTFSIPLYLAVAAGLLSSAGSIASVAGPDIWAGVLILSWALLLLSDGKLAPGIRTGLAGLITMAVLFHASHLLLGIGLAAGTLGLLVLFPRSFGAAALVPAGIAVAAAVAGIVVTVAGGLFAFEEPSIAPKQYPIVLARALADGPAHDYLTEVCPEAGYVVCELYGDDIPDDVGEFLWGERGVARIATPEQLDRLRSEEGAIIAASMRRDPVEQLFETAENITDQALRFSLKGTEFGLYQVAENGGGVRTEGARNRGALVSIYTKASTAVVWFSLAAGVLALAAAKPGESRRRAFLLAAVIAGGLAANAVICGALSAPVHRYQVRVIWLVPLGAAAVWSLTMTNGQLIRATRRLEQRFKQHRAKGLAPGDTAR
jgi:hypothetical protein